MLCEKASLSPLIIFGEKFIYEDTWGEIDDWLNLVALRKNELKDVEEDIQDLQDEKARILIQAGNVSESLLESQFNDIKGWYEQKERASVRLSQLEDELENNISKMDELKEQMNNLNPANSQVKILKKVHKVLEEINKAFFRAQKDNLRRFLTELEKRANEYLDKLPNDKFTIEASRAVSDARFKIREVCTKA